MSRLALNTNGATMLLDDCLRECKTQSRSSFGSGCGGIDLLKTIEQFRLEFLRNAGAAIDDTETNTAVVRFRLDIDRLCLWRILDGIRDEVDQYLNDVFRIGFDEYVIGAGHHI